MQPYAKKSRRTSSEVAVSALAPERAPCTDFSLSVTPFHFFSLQSPEMGHYNSTQSQKFQRSPNLFDTKLQYHGVVRGARRPSQTKALARPPAVRAFSHQTLLWHGAWRRGLSPREVARGRCPRDACCPRARRFRGPALSTPHLSPGAASVLGRLLDEHGRLGVEARLLRVRARVRLGLGWDRVRIRLGLGLGLGLG